MKNKKLWRFIALMLSVFVAFGVMNVPNSAGVVHAEGVEYSIWSNDMESSYNAPDYPDKNHAAVISFEITPALEEGATVMLSHAVTGAMTWQSEIVSTEADCTVVRLRGWYGSSSAYDSWYYLGIMIKDADGNTVFDGNLNDETIYITNRRISVTLNGNGGKYYNSDTNKYDLPTYTAKVKEGYSLSSAIRSIQWPEADKKILDGYKISGDSSGKIYTDNYDKYYYNPDKYERFYNFYVDKNLTLNAVWVDAVKVTLNAGEGYFYKWGSGSSTEYGRVYDYTVCKGEELELSDLYLSTPVTDTNKVFMGWRCSADGKLYAADNIYYYVPTANTTFTAEYCSAYTVKFVSKEGGIGGDPDVKEESLKYKPNTYINSDRGSAYASRPGYILAGWNDGSKTYKTTEINNYKVTGNVTFNAVWSKRITSTVTLNSNYPKNWGYADTKSIRTQDAKDDYGSGIYLSSNTFSHPSKYAIETYHTSDGTKYPAEEYFIPTSSKHDLYADWTEFNIFKINMHSNYPSGWGKEQTVLERNAYSYNYFYPSSNANSQTIRFKGKEEYYISYWFYYNSKGEKVQVSNRFKPTGNMDLYANWTTDLSHSHTWDSGKVLEEATYEKDGRILYKCKMCSEEHIDRIPKLVHKYSSEWRDGKWYNADGTQTYAPTGSWKSDASGWWFEDSSGWYAKNEWVKIDGKWYFFTDSGYMDYSEYRDGCWLGSDGAWDEAYSGGHWMSDSTGWWYTDNAGWYPVSQYVWIDGVQYWFGASGYWE